MAPVKDNTYMYLANAVNEDSISLENKLTMIEQGCQGTSLTSKQVLQLVGIAIRSQKDGIQRYKKILAALAAIMRMLGRTRTAPDNKLLNGHEYVEMGDGLKWATCNVGAEKPEDSGTLFRWGDVVEGHDTSWSTYKWGPASNLTKYNAQGTAGVVDNKFVLDPSDDAASVNWGSTWRTPTKEELMVLTDNSKFNWAWDSTLEGYWVISKIAGFEGNKIFFPAHAVHLSNGIREAAANYWSSSVYKESCNHVYLLNILESSYQVIHNLRCYLMYVRPVSF